MVQDIEQVFTQGRTNQDVVTTAFEGVEQWWSNRSRGDELDIEEIGDIATIGMTGAHGNANKSDTNDTLFDVSFDADVLTNNDAVDVVLDSVTTRNSTNALTRDDSTPVDAFAQNEGILDVEGFETMNIATQGDDSTLKALKSNGDLETLNVSGDAGLSIGDDLEVGVSTISADDHSGGLSVGFGAVEASNVGVTATTGAGNDTVDASSVTQTELNDQNTTVDIATGAGDDVVNLTSITTGADRDFEGTLNIDGGQGGDALALAIAGTSANEFERFLNLDNVNFTNFVGANLTFAGAQGGMFDAATIDTLQGVALNTNGQNGESFTLENAGEANTVTVNNELDSNNEVGKITVNDLTASSFNLVLNGDNFDQNLTENEAGAGALDVEAATVNVVSEFDDSGIRADPDFDATVVEESDSGTKVQNNVGNIGESDNESIRTVNLSGTLGVDVGTVNFTNGDADASGETVTLNSSADGDTDIDDVEVGDNNEELAINATGGTADSRLEIESAIAADFLDTVTFTGSQNIVLNGFDEAGTTDEGLAEVDASDLSGDLTIGTFSPEVGDGFNEDLDSDATNEFTLTGGDGKLTATLSSVDDTDSDAAQTINTGAGGSEITIGGFDSANDNTIDFNGGSGDDKVFITADTAPANAFNFGEGNTLNIDGGEGTNSVEVEFTGTQDTVRIADLANVSSVVLDGNMNGEALVLGLSDAVNNVESDDVEISAFAQNSIVAFQSTSGNPNVDLTKDGPSNIIEDALGTTTFGAFGDGNDNVLTGDDAANIFDGGAGADTLIGGGGDDTFVFGDPDTDNGNTISDGSGNNDFNTGGGDDTLDLNTAALSNNGTGDSLGTLTGATGSNALMAGDSLNVIDNTNVDTATITDFDLSTVSDYLNSNNGETFDANDGDDTIGFTANDDAFYFAISDGNDTGIFYADAARGAATDAIIDADDLVQVVTLTGVSDASSIVAGDFDLS